MTTIKEIAQKAKVSVGTVDRVIHSRGRVSPETAEKIKMIIKELDYKPNVLARSLSRSKGFHFGVVIPRSDQDGKYWQLPLNGIKKAQHDLAHYKVTVSEFVYEKHSEDDFQQACDQVLNSINEIDGLVIAPVLSKAAEQFIKKIPKNIPYIFIDSYLPNANSLSYVGEDSYQGGILAARLLNLITDGSGDVAIIKILPLDYHLEDRAQGFIDTLKNFRIHTFFANTLQEPNAFSSITKKILADLPQLRGIFTPNACTFQVAECIDKEGRNDIKLVGYELVDENIKYIKNGVIDFVISQRAEMQGYEAIYTLHKNVVLNQSVEPNQIMPLDVIMKENLNSYINWHNLKIH